MHDQSLAPMPISFETRPEQYKHWRLQLDGQLAKLTMKVQEDGGLRDGYRLKLNSYDLAVDIELADVVQRLRFEHPEVKVVVLTSEQDKVFSAGANIYMLGQSDHGFKVNFCKFTNETRLGMEDASAHSGIKFLAALNGITAGGGYELAMACDEIWLVDDGNSAVSLPEVPLLGVLPGTGGLTRLVDKRKVRRDLADAFCTIAEGVRGQKAKEWNLVDEVIPKSDWDKRVEGRARELAARDAPLKMGDGVKLTSVYPYQYVSVKADASKRLAEITISGPREKEPTTREGLRQKGAELWMLRAYRELDDAILNLRLNAPQIGLMVFRTQGDSSAIVQAEKAVVALAAGDQPDWFAKEVLLYVKRVLKRLDVTSKTLVTLIEPGSAFASSLAELVFLADRSFWLNDGNPTAVELTSVNYGALTMGNGLTRLETRFFGSADQVNAIKRAAAEGPLSAESCNKLGLVTSTLDEIDYEDEVRIFLEERASLSPDALTGMEANLRFVGPETMETKIFSRLSAWQNWIFYRPNATGSAGALTNYGKTTRPQFDFRRC